MLEAGAIVDEEGDRVGFGSGRAPPLRIKRPSERRSRSRSAIRALDILECFGAERRPLRAFEICRVLDLQPSTTDQLLKTMVDSGHLVFDARRKTYAPSPRLIGFGSWLVDTFGPADELHALVRDVQQRSAMVVTLTTANDLFMQVIDAAVPPGSQTERGLRISVFGSVIGTAYLATLEHADLERLVYRARIPAVDLPDIETRLDLVRRSGFADGPAPDGDIWSLAMAVPSLGPIPLILGLAGPAARVIFDRDGLQSLMKDAVSRWLGPLAGDI